MPLLCLKLTPLPCLKPLPCLTPLPTLVFLGLLCTILPLKKTIEGSRVSNRKGVGSSDGINDGSDMASFEGFSVGLKKLNKEGVKVGNPNEGVGMNVGA
jgi:hypothetical protein